MSPSTKRSPTASRRSSSGATRPRRTSSTSTRGAAGSRSQRAGKGNAAARGALIAGRYLWAVLTGLVIAALLFEPTMVWTLGVGLFMLANAELAGLWLVVVGYGMSCLPAAFGMLVATGRFWFSLTHGLWIGILYSVAGVLFLEHILVLLN